MWLGVNPNSIKIETENGIEEYGFNELSKELGFTFINLNKYDLNINWETDTKDKGGHLNYFGALKASNVIGNILKDTNLLVDHRGDKNYKLWDTAYLRYKEEVEK